MIVVSHDDYMIRPTSLDDYKDLLSVTDLSVIFEVSKQTIYKELKEGKFGVPVQIGRAYKIPKIYIIKKYFHNSN